MKKIPLEILFRLDEKITNLPCHGKLRRELIQEVATHYQLSESSVYRQLNQLSLHPNERKSRKDKGTPRIIIGEDTLTALDFLYRAFSKISDSQPELYGIPDFIYTDNASFVKSKLFMRVMMKLGVQILTHLPRGKGGRKTTSRAKGKSERHHRTIKSMVEPLYQFDKPFDLNEANGYLDRFMVELGNMRHRSQHATRYQVVMQQSN